MAVQVGDLWADSNGDDIYVDCLLPTGIIIRMQVPKDIALLEIKEVLWEHARMYPLFSRLLPMDSYVFTCVNNSAEVEMLMEETRHLCDVRPFQPVLKVVEHKGNKYENLINSQISTLIGKGLHEFDALQNEEVTTFRQQVRHFCESVANKRLAEKSEVELLVCRYPPDVDRMPQLPQHLYDKLKARYQGKIAVSVTFDNTKISYTLLEDVYLPVQELVQSALIKRSYKLNREPEAADNYVFKVIGRDEFMLGNYPIAQYRYIRMMVAKGEIPQLILMSLNCLLEDDNIYGQAPAISQNSTSGTLLRKKRSQVALPKKDKEVMSWHVEEEFRLTVNKLSNLDNLEDSTKVAVRLCVYHGADSMCSVQDTKEVTVVQGGASFNEFVFFDIDVKNLPRAAKLCCVVYEVGKVVKTKGKKKNKQVVSEVHRTPLAWSNVQVFDFRGRLHMGDKRLQMWAWSPDIHTENNLYPMGTIECNPDTEGATRLDVSFHPYTNYFIEVLPVVYPSYVQVLQRAVMMELTGRERTQTLTRGSKLHLRQLNDIVSRDPLHQMHEQEKDLFWTLRHDCKERLAYSLPKLLQCVKWNNSDDVAEMQELLRTWPSLDPEDALELLDYVYADEWVRRYAVQCIRVFSDAELSLYLLQLVQALKHEPYYHCELAEFLLERALNNQRIAHRFFWHLRSEIHEPAVSVKFGLLLEAYCRGNIGHMRTLMRQTESLNKLKSLSQFIKGAEEGKFIKGAKVTGTKKEVQDFALKICLEQKSYSDALTDLQSPLSPAQRLKSIKVNKCRVMDSKKKPLWLVFDNFDNHLTNSSVHDVYLIFKHGDDLRQDMLTLQMISLMDQFWQAEGLDLRMNAYGCISTGEEVGMIEVVRHADTVANIQKEQSRLAATSSFNKEGLYAWLRQHHSDEASLQRAVEEFTLSCAGYCVATYVIGVGDRHSDNIMVKTNGQLFHIDFGHFLGNVKTFLGFRREHAPFVLTADFVYVITKGQGTKAEEFTRFRGYCERAFKILRRKGHLLITLFAMMLSTGIPELQQISDLEYLQDTLVLNQTESEAVEKFRGKFDEALRSAWLTSLNFNIHNMAKDNKHT